MYFTVPIEIGLRLPLKYDMDFDNFVVDAKEQINILEYFFNIIIENVYYSFNKKKRTYLVETYYQRMDFVVKLN